MITEEDLKEMEAKLDTYGELGHGLEQQLIDEVRRLRGLIEKAKRFSGRDQWDMPCDDLESIHLILGQA